MGGKVELSSGLCLKANWELLIQSNRTVFFDTFKPHSITFIMSRFAVYIERPISIGGVSIARVGVHIERFNNYFVLLKIVTKPRRNLWKIRTVIVLWK